MGLIRTKLDNKLGLICKKISHSGRKLRAKTENEFVGTRVWRYMSLGQREPGHQTLNNPLQTLLKYQTLDNTPVAQHALFLLEHAADEDADGEEDDSEEDAGWGIVVFYGPAAVGAVVPEK